MATSLLILALAAILNPYQAVETALRAAVWVDGDGWHAYPSPVVKVAARVFLISLILNLSYPALLKIGAWIRKGE
jgi:hypothetical protein